MIAKHTGDNLGEGGSFKIRITHAWPPQQPAHGYQGSCPTIRWVNGYYYVLTLWVEKGGWGTHVQRSKDPTTRKHQEAPISTGESRVAFQLTKESRPE